MQLSDEHRAKITSWLATHQLVTNCPMCADIAWNFTDFMWGMTPTVEGNPQISQAADPMIQTVCTSCGYVRLLSARVMALVP